MTRSKSISHKNVGPLVSYLTSLNPELVARNVGANSNGQRMVIPALETDPVIGISNLVRQAGGEAAVVVAVFRGDSLSLRVANVTVSVTEDSGDHHVPFGDDTTVGDLLKVMTSGSSMTLSYDAERFEMDALGQAEFHDAEIPARFCQA